MREWEIHSPLPPNFKYLVFVLIMCFREPWIFLSEENLHIINLISYGSSTVLSILGVLTITSPLTRAPGLAGYIYIYIFGSSLGCYIPW